MPRSDGSAEFKEKTKHFKGKSCEPFHKQNPRTLTKRCGRYLIMRKTETQEEGGLQAQSCWHPGRASVRARGYVLTGRGRKNSSEHLPESWGWRGILINV